MKIKQLKDGMKGPGTAVLAALIAIATVSPGGAFTSAGSADESVSTTNGASFRAFASALMDDAPVVEAAEEVVTTEVVEPETKSTEDAPASSGDDIPAIFEQINTAVSDAAAAADDAAVADLSDVTQQAAEQEQQLAQASTEDVVAALLGLLNSAQPQVMSAIDAAEAAVLAKVDQARADTVAAFAMTELPEEAAILAQIDLARGYVEQAFDLVREMVNQAFADARNTVIEELTGVDFGDAADTVLAKIAEVQSFVNTAMAKVQQMLEGLGVNI